MTVANPAPRGAAAFVPEAITTRFEAQAARSAARLAVRGRDAALTYADLDAFANRIAWAVLDRTGRPAGVTALLLEHDAALVAAALGVLKAGGCYVPLDPASPSERTLAVLVDSGAQSIVADGRHRALADELAARAGGGVRVLDVDETRRQPSARPGIVVAADAPCFVVYTSGSTGRPKGVCHEHRTVVHGAWAYGALAEIDADDRLSLLHSLGAMAGATTLFGALLNGAALLPFDVKRHGVERLAAWLAAERVTCLHTVPTAFRRLAPHVPGTRAADAVRLVRLGGEAVTQTEWRLWRRHFRERSQLQVSLSASEAGLFRLASYDRHADPPEVVLPVGHAVPDKEVVLVDDAGTPVAPGEVGHVVVKSPYLFSGYWRQPDETARVRSVDPVDGRAIFRTGDLGRFTADGRLLHVGRSDAQLKIDGHRVETAEVEHVLRGVEWIRDAAVVPRRRGPNDVRLVGFVAPAAVGTEDRPAMREHLRRLLPAHMVPAAVVVVDELPLLRDGKLDRRALEERAGAVGAPHVAPRNPVEETLLEIWERALGVTGLGVDDDFFLALGGDSLAAVQILAAVEEVFGQGLPLDAFHEATTVGTMAARLLDGGWRAPENGRLVVHPAGARPPLFGICGAFGHALRLMLVGQALDEQQPFHGLQPPGMDWERTGCRTIEAMAAHYRSEIRRIQPHGPYHLLGTSFGGVMAFEVAVQLQRAGEEVALLAMIDTTPPDCVTPAGVDRAVPRDWNQPAGDGDRLVAMGVRVAAAHGAALARYRLDRTFAGRIVYFRCAESHVVPAADRRHLWAGFATEGADVVPVPGGHGQFHREPQFSAVVGELRARLSAFEPRRP